MKILLTLHHYPPDHVAGVELIVQRLARWLLGRGHQVEVVAIRRIDAPSGFEVESGEYDGVPVHRLDLNLVGRPEGLGVRFRDERVAAWFAEHLRRARPDLLHSHSGYLLTAAPLEAARAVGVPTVVTLHDYWYLCPRITLLRSDDTVCRGVASAAECTWCLMGERRRYRRLGQLLRTVGGPAGAAAPSAPPGWLLDSALHETLRDRQPYLLETLAGADQLISPAPLALELLAERGLPADAVRLVRSGLELDAYRAIRAAPAPGRLRIGYLGQIAPHKGIHVLVAAFLELRGGATSPELHIHGNPTAFPDYSADLVRQAGDHPGVRFHGPYDNRQVTSILSELDLVVTPSVWYEVRPSVILEAQAAGLPVITARQINLAAMVRDEVDGLLFTPGDAPDLARQLQRCLDEPDLLARLRGAVPQVRSFEQEMLEVESIYREVLARRDAVGGTSGRIGGTNAT